MTTDPSLTVQALASRLEHHWLDSTLREAEIIRDYPAGEDRVEEARKLIRFVLYEFALGKIDPATRNRILDILQFAAERSHVMHEQPTPAYQDEEV